MSCGPGWAPFLLVVLSHIVGNTYYKYAWLAIGNIARSLEFLSTNQFEMECVSPLLAVFVEVTHEESTSSTHGLRYPNNSIVYT